MLTFSRHMERRPLTEGFNLAHLEDLVFNDPEEGLDLSLNLLNDLVKQLSTPKYNMTMSVTTKWDGAPAIVVGYDSAGKYFVSLKGAIGSKNPKICYSEKDIDTHYEGEVANKLKDCFRLLKSVIPSRGIYQGDLLFTRGTKKDETINGVANIAFRPNTITYAVPKDTPMGKKIQAAEMGIVFHTEYRGNDFSSLSSAPLTSTASFKQSTKVWFTDAKLPTPPSGAFVPPSETATIAAIVKQINAIKATALSAAKLMATKPWWAVLKPTINAAIRAGVSSVNTAMLKTHLTTKSTAAIAKLKTDAGKKKKQGELDDALKFIDTYATQIDNLFKVHGLIAQAKLVIVNQLAIAANGIGTYVPTDNGLKATAPEGFVAVCGKTCQVIKLVDRMEFSRMNFNLAKDWKK